MICFRSVSEYWLNHYQFDKESPKKRNHFLILCRFDCYKYDNSVTICLCKKSGKEISEDLIQLLKEVSPEKMLLLISLILSNCFKSAFDSQSLIQLKNEYCNKSKCLECRVGIELLKNSGLVRHQLDNFVILLINKFLKCLQL
jgi:hypothetical protein